MTELPYTVLQTNATEKTSTSEVWKNGKGTVEKRSIKDWSREKITFSITYLSTLRIPLRLSNTG